MSRSRSRVDCSRASVVVKHLDLPLYKTYALGGSGPLPYAADVVLKQIHDLEFLQRPTEKFRKPEYVIKLSWVCETRRSRGKYDARLRAAVSRIDQHLPCIIGWAGDGSLARNTRQELGIAPRASFVPQPVGNPVEVSTDTARELTTTVSEKLEPLTKLAGAEFLKVFLHIAHCHYLAWTQSRVYYRDPSTTNFMYRVIGKEKVGVLNDWDLATDDTSPLSGLERTGTLPFMALELLDITDGSVEHLYRHDLEAMFWMLVWLCYPRGTFQSWATAEYRDCYDKKLSFFTHREPLVALPGWEGVTSVVQDTLVPHYWGHFSRMTTHNLDKKKAIRRGNPVPVLTEFTPEETWREFCELLQDSADEVSETFPDIAMVLRRLLTDVL